MKRYLNAPPVWQLIVGFFLLASVCAHSQTTEELLAKLKNAKQDSAKATLYNALSKSSVNESPVEARKYAMQAFVFSEKAKAKNNMAASCSNIGYSYLTENNYDTAILFFNKGIQISSAPIYKKINSELLSRKAATFYYKGMTDSSLIYFQRSLVQYQQLKDSNEIIKLLNNIGAINLRTGDLDEALSCFMKALKFDEKQKNDVCIALDCNNIGIILTDKKDFTSAMNYLERSLKIRTGLHDSTGLMKTLHNIGNLYYIKKDFDKGILFYKRVLTIIDSTKNTREYAQATNNIGGCYSETGDYVNAMKYLRIALNSYKKLGDNSGQASSYGNMAGVYYNQKNYGKAIEYNLQSYKKAVETGDLDFQKNAQKVLAQCYMKLNNSEAAIKSFEIFNYLQDSLYNENSSRQLSEIQIKYESAKKENDNKLLQQQNQIKTLENDNNQKKLRTQTQTIFILIAGIIVAVVIVLWQISLARIKKQKRELENEKKLQKDRERISRDLHDNVGGQLSYVLFSLEGDEDTDSDKRKEKLKSLADSIRSVTGNLRETIWALNKETLSIKDLSDKLKLYARNMFSYSDTKLKFEEYIDKDQALNPALALNLFRICQEIINNVFKHAHATEIKITISKKDTLQLEISDNGVGFNDQEKNMESFGLENLKKRAEEINATLTIKSDVGKGTTITILV